MMWMMGYNDGGEFNGIQDPFAGRKLRPLIPRPATAAATSPPCLTRLHGTDLLALNHHLAMVEQSKRELNTQQVVVSSRWNPTPEQLQTLEELYRRGTRTPSADQIQQITAQLRRYGKIEGKNVFYWFQNHKARERQKRRRQHDEQPHYSNCDKREPPPPGANRTVFEVEQAKNWASPTNSCTAADQRGVCTQAAAKAAEASECKADGWVHIDAGDDIAAADMISQHRRNATWQPMHLSSSSPPTNLINPSSAAATSLTNSAVVPSAFGAVPETSKPPNQDFIDILFKPYNSRNLDGYSSAAAAGGEEAQTLQLFPLHRRSCEEEEESDVGLNSGCCHVPPYQFFEFLPLKN